MRNILTLILVALLISSAQAQQPEAKKAKAGRLENVNAQPDIEYAKAGDVSLKLDVYTPKTESQQARPCVVWIHGGGWQGGNKTSGAGRVGPMVATGDYVGASVGYRLTDVGSFPAQIHDCKAAIRFLRANAAKYGIDANKIGVFGSSAGGHLVALLGTSADIKEVEGELGTTGVSSRVTCVVDFCGPADFLAFGVTNPRLNEPGQPVYKLFGGPLKDKQDLAKQASPVTYASKEDPPFLIMHGTEDATVNIRQGELMHAALKQAGVDSTFVKIEGGGHGFGGPEVEARVRAFFDKHLLGKAVSVSPDSIQAATGGEVASCDGENGPVVTVSQVFRS